MRSSQGPLRAAALLLFSALLASCGGGGGGGGGGPGSGTAAPGDASPPPANVFGAVSISLVSPTSIRQEYAEMETAPELSVYLVGTGELQALNGRTLYAIVEDPDSISGGQASVQLGTQPVSGSNARVQLSGRDMNKPGRFQGELKLHACLDSACATELAGSPLRVPYDITVRPGLTLARQEIAVTIPFGEVAPVQSIEADLPAGMSEWHGESSFPYFGVPPNRTQASTTQTSPGKGRVDLQVVPVPPGSYKDFVDVSAVLTTPHGTTLTQRRTITVTYTVTPNPAIDFVVFPTEGRFTVQAGAGGFQFKRVEVYNQGIGFSGMAPEVQYLSSPPEAAGNPLLDVWLNDTVDTVYPCSAPPGLSASRTCLPPGTYTARVKMRYLKGSSIATAYWPVTLTIVP